jgi:hypothetical protein
VYYWSFAGEGCFCWRRLFAVERSPLHRTAAHFTGEDRLDKFLIIAVFLIAVAQALTILLTIRRERDIKKLGELVDKQRLQVVELRAWLAGRNAAQPRPTKSEREPTNEPVRQSIADNTKVSESAITPKELPESGTTEDGPGRATKAFRWFKEDGNEPREMAAAREIVASVRAGLGGGAAPAEPATTAKDLPEAGAAEDEAAQAMKVLNWQREIVAGLRAGLGGTAVPAEPAITRATEPAITPKELLDTMRPSTTEDEFKRATKAINWLIEDMDKPREIGGSSRGTKKIG